MIALVGLTVMVASYHRPTPKTVDQFVKQYNEEIRAAVKRNMPQNSVERYIRECLLNNVSDRGRGRKYQSINQAFFDTYESNELVIVSFMFYENVNPDILFSVIEASIAAVGDDYETVATSLGIFNNNRYVIPSEYKRTIELQDKTYLIDRGYSRQYGNVVFFKIDIPKR